MMSTPLNEFPLPGVAIATVIGAAAKPDQLWTLIDIETLADAPALVLGELWQKARLAPVLLKTRDLCAALKLAQQVISLNVRLDSNPSIHLVVEDGIAVDCNLRS